MRCIHIYRGAPQLGGIKLHKHFPWFHTAKWGVHRIAPRTVLHVIRIVLTMELQPLKTVQLHGWVCLPDSLVRNGSTSTIGGDYKRTHTHTHTHTHTLRIYMYLNIHTHTHIILIGIKYWGKCPVPPKGPCFAFKRSLVGKTGDYDCTYMRERAKRASASEFRNSIFSCNLIS